MSLILKLYFCFIIESKDTFWDWSILLKEAVLAALSFIMILLPLNLLWILYLRIAASAGHGGGLEYGIEEIYFSAVRFIKDNAGISKAKGAFPVFNLFYDIKALLILLISTSRETSS